MAVLSTDGLLDLLLAGETVLFPTPRSAGQIKIRFDRVQHDRGLRAWEPPRSLAWGAWTESLWSRLTLEGGDDRILMNRLQELSVWTGIIQQHHVGAVLNRGSLRELAELARSAWQLASAHLPGPELSRLQRAADTPDAQTFAVWALRFHEHCHGFRLLSRATLEAALSGHLRDGSLRPPAVLHLAGFLELSPAQSDVLRDLRASGATVSVHELAMPAAAGALRASVIAADPREELCGALRWIKAQYTAPSAVPPSVALLLPNPAAERSELEPLLREILAPELEVVGADLSSTPWHFGAGQPLSSTPVIADALLLLRWTLSEISLEKIGILLLSPFLTHASSFEVRSRYETRALRRTKQLRPEMNLRAFLSAARHASSAQVETPDLAPLAKLSELVGAPGLLSGSGSHADWSELVRKLLRTVGWPGQRTPAPEQFRVTEAWEGLLDQLATLDFSGDRLNFPQFLQLLSEQAADLPAPAAIGGAPVEILTLAETEACTFDAAIILRATDANLPPPERLHSLLGVALQRSLRLPGSDPAHAYTRTRDRLQSLAARCRDLLFLSAAVDENGPLRPTPLIEELGLLPRTLESLAPAPPTPPPVIPERITERQATLPLPSAEVHGGAKILELQAACGFRAFASLRLHADVPETRSLGLDARERGNILHNALEAFWKEVKSQAALRALTSGERRSALLRGIRHGFERYRAAAGPDDAWSQAYVEISEKWLITLLERWLEFELRRGDFTVLPPEQEELVQVGPLQLKVRPDRIDQVKDGFVFVDYKTSSDLSTAHWLGERPQAPQLPLYALLGEPDEVRGLAFARLRPGKQMDWIGLQTEKGELPQRRPSVHNLEDQVIAWREELDRLAQEFADGVTTVDPKSYPGTCRYCEQRLLCRLDAATLLAQPDETREAELAEGADG